MKRKILPRTSDRQENWQQTEERKIRTTPLTISTVPYPLQQSQRQRKVCTVPPSAPTECLNKIVPARHSTQRSHIRTENIWPGPPEKFPRTQHTQNKQTGDKYNRRINTHRLQNNKTKKRKKNLHQEKAVFTVITEYIRKSRSLIRPDENRIEPNTYKIKIFYLDMIGQTAKNWRNLDDLPFRKHSADWPI